MASNTPNYELKKPEGTDFYRVEDQNENMDKLDGALHGLKMLADGKAPTSHAAQHGATGSDPVTPAAIGAASQADVAALEAALSNRAINDFGTVVADLDTATTPGHGNYLDLDGTFGSVGLLYDLEVSKTTFDSSIGYVQILTRVYRGGMSTARLFRSYYSADGWSEWAKLTTTGELEASLSNKVSINAINANGLDCNSYLQNGQYQCLGELLHSPPWSGLYGHFFLDVHWHMDEWVVQVAHRVNAPGVYTRNNLGGTWSAWQTIATATPPQWYPIEFQEGYQTAIYAQYGQVNGKLYIRGVFSAPTELSPGGTIFILPEGFKPAVQQDITVAATGPTWTGAAGVYADGSVRWNGHGVSPVPSGSYLIFPSNTFVWL